MNRPVPLFQFHFGTTDSVPVGMAISRRSKFQFHFGTTDSRYILNGTFHPRRFQFHFGTTDRLVSQSEWVRVPGFNSTLVRLIDSNWIMTQVVGQRFNSTLVRLIGYPEFKKDVVLFTFQFHFGTTDRVMYTNTQDPAMLFQFHFGTTDSHIEPDNGPGQ